MKKRLLKAILFRKKPVHLILHVTNKCNLKCRTCFVKFKNNGHEELSIDEVRKIADYLDEILWLDISGGEPFLRKDLPEICTSFNTGSIAIPTNGFNPVLINESVGKIVGSTEAEVSISLSIDGFEETNDSIRNKGCFKKSMETLELLQKNNGIRIKINTVLCEKNYPEIIKFMEYIKGLDVDFHSIIFLRGTSRDPLFRLPSYENLEKIKNDVFKIWSTYNYGFRTMEGKVLQGYQRCMFETSLRVIREKQQLPKCLAGKYHVVVQSNGDVSFCELIAPMGNIRNASFGEILRSKKAEMYRKHIKDKQCYCYHNCNLLDNYFLNPLQYPKLLGSILK